MKNHFAFVSPKLGIFRRLLVSSCVLHTPQGSPWPASRGVLMWEGTTVQYTLSLSFRSWLFRNFCGLHVKLNSVDAGWNPWPILECFVVKCVKILISTLKLFLCLYVNFFFWSTSFILEMLNCVSLLLKKKREKLGDL